MTISKDELLVAARLVLIVVFLIAGFAKLSNLHRFIEELKNFGFTNHFNKIIGLTLPWIELSLVLFLMMPFSVWWASSFAMFLLIIFAILIIYNLLQGRHPSCNCFGVSNKPIDSFTLLRNLILIICSFFVVLIGPQYEHINIFSWLSNLFYTIETSLLITLILLLIISVEGWLILKIFRQNGRLILRLDNLELKLKSAGIKLSDLHSLSESYGFIKGAPVPNFSLSNLNGEVVSLDGLLALKKFFLLVFTSPGCGPCSALVPKLLVWEKELNPNSFLLLISNGTIIENTDKFSNLRKSNILIYSNLNSEQIPALYKEVPTPSAVRISKNGFFDSYLAVGDIAITSLVNESLSVSSQRHHLSFSRAE